MRVQLFCPNRLASTDLKLILDEALEQCVLPPFDQSIIDFVSDFSKSILLDKRSRAYPELIVLANFFKINNLKKFQNELPQLGYCASRGLVFHVAPSNVDSIFLYSSLLSLLCGNINLIRVSSKGTDQINYVIDKLNELLSEQHHKIAGRLILMTYEHNDIISTEISKGAHMRVVWGGDETVSKIRSLALRPTATELCFPDRFSAAMFSASAVIRLQRAALLDLCSRFFNDSIWFSQQACSSPRLISWIGSNEECVRAREIFWSAFSEYLSNNEYENSPGMAMDRLVSACLIASESLQCETTELSFPLRILLKSQSLSMLSKYHCGNGLFYEQFFQNISEFFHTMNDRNQTLSVFGFNSGELTAELQALPLRSVDRITKIGNALDFDCTWDGVNLLQAFTRKISVNV